MRLFTPLLFLGAAAWVFHHNQDSSTVVIFPFVDAIFPSTKGDPVAMGNASAGVLAALGALFGLRELGWALRESRSRGLKEDEE